MKKSTNPLDYQEIPRPVAAMPKDFAAGATIAPHRHRRAQLIYAATGVMRVSTSESEFVVPPLRALWMPPDMEHRLRMEGAVAMRTL